MIFDIFFTVGENSWIIHHTFFLSTYLVLGIFDNIWAKNVEQHPPEVEIIMHFPELSVESDLLCTCFNDWVSISLLNAHKGIKIRWVVDLNCAMETEDCLKKVKTNRLLFTSCNIWTKILYKKCTTNKTSKKWWLKTATICNSFLVGYYTDITWIPCHFWYPKIIFILQK